MTYLCVLTTDFYSNPDYQSTTSDFTSWSSGSTVVFFGCRVYTKSYDSKYYSTSHASLLRETPTHPFTRPSWISHTIHKPFPPTLQALAGLAQLTFRARVALHMRASLPSWAAGKSKHSCWTRPKAPARFRVTEHRSAGGRTELLAKTLKVTAELWNPFLLRSTQSGLLWVQVLMVPNLDAFQVLSHSAGVKLVFKSKDPFHTFLRFEALTNPRNQPCQRIPKYQPSGKEGRWWD